MLASYRAQSRFTAALTAPMALYAAFVLALVVGAFATITREALSTALADRNMWLAVRLSLTTSAISTLLSVAVAVPAGYVLARRRFPGQVLVDTLLDLPIVLPPLVMGLCLLIFFNLTDRLQAAASGTTPSAMADRFSDLFVYRPAGIVLAQFVVGCALAIRVMEAGFRAQDRRFEDVAMTLGAGPLRTFLRVVLPMAMPSLVAGAVISWARIFGLFGPVLLVAGTMRARTEIMPTTIFLEASIGRIEVALVVAAFMILISVTTLVVFKKLGGRGYFW